jgi:hypothetical protein
MEPMFIGRDHVASLLDALMEGYTVVAPGERKGPAVFDRLASGSEAALSFTASAASLKEAVMPRLETLLLHSTGTEATCPFRLTQAGEGRLSCSVHAPATPGGFQVSRRGVS